MFARERGELGMNRARSSSSGRCTRTSSGRPSSRGISGTDLREMARNEASVEEFAAQHSQRTSSEVGVEQAVREAEREGRRQAWAPPRRDSLSSSSARFQQEPQQDLPPHPTKKRTLPGKLKNEVECSLAATLFLARTLDTLFCRNTG